MTSAPATLVAGINPASTRPGGIRSYVLGLAKYLSAAGVDVTLIGVGSAQSVQGCRFISVVPKTKVSSFTFHRRLRQHLRKTGSPGGIVHVQRPDDLAPFASMGVRGGGVITVHGDPLPGIRARHGPVVASGYLRLERRGIAAARRVLFIDAATRLAFSERHPVAVDKFGATTIGVDLEEFHRVDSSPALKKWKLNEGPHLLFAGRLETEKNLRLLADAVRNCKTSPVLLLAGEGREGQSLPEYFRGVAHRYLGVVSHEEMPALFSAVEATVLSSHREAMPTVCLESLACGTPVVATPVGRLPEVIKPGKNGFLPPPEPIAFARCIDDVVQNHSAMIHACRESAIPFGWDIVLPSLLREYGEALR